MFQSGVNVAVQNEMADFMRDGEAQAVFEARIHEGAFVHEDGFQVAHEQGVNVQLLAQAVHGNQIETEIEFGKVEDFNGQFRPAGCAARKRSASCQIRSLGLYGALNLRGSFKVCWRF